MTEKLNKNLNTAAAGLIIVNLLLDLYDRFSRNKKTGKSKDEDTQPEENNTHDSES